MLRLQLDNLRMEKQELKSENVWLQREHPERVVLTDLEMEQDCYCKVSEQQENNKLKEEIE